MCQRNLTRRAVPAIPKAIRRTVDTVRSGFGLYGNYSGGNGSNMTEHMIQYVNSSVYIDCYQLGGIETVYGIPYVSVAWMAVAIPFGIVTGAILALLTFRFCCKRYWKQENGASRNNVSTRSKTARSTQFGYKPLVNNELDDPGENPEEEEVVGGGIGDAEISRHVADASTGIADALIQNSPEKVESALFKQDLETVQDIENELAENRNAISQGFVQVYLNQISEGTKADQAIIAKLMETLRLRLDKMEKDIEKEFQRKLQVLRGSQDFKDHSDRMEEELEKLNTETRRRRHVMFKDALNEFKESLRKETKLNETQLSDFIAQLSKSLADLEEVLNEYMDGRIQMLYERGTFRKHLAETVQNTDEDTKDYLKNQEKALEKSLHNLAQKKNIDKHTEQEIIKEFRNALQKLRKSHKRDIEKQMEETAKRLKKYRTEEMKKLKKRHREQLKKLTATTTSEPDEYLSNVHSLLDKHNEELAYFWSGIDKDETSKLNNSYLKLEDGLQQAVKDAINHTLDKPGLSQLTQTELKTLKRDQELEAGELERLSEMDRNLRQTEMTEKLQENNKKAKVELHKQDAELQTISDKQADTLHRVLNAQININDQDRQRILSEHSYNRNLLNSLMKLEQVKQEKMLEGKLADRRQSIANHYSDRKSSDRRSNRHNQSIGDTDQIQKFLTADFDKDMANLELEKQEMLQKIRKKMAKESKLLVDKQDEAMAEVIGHLQVGRARRQAVLERQNKLVQRLELELQKRAKIVPVDNKSLEELLSTYKENLDQLNEKLEESRKKQLNHLKDKLESKRLNQKKSLENKFEEQEHAALSETNKAKISFTGTQMYQGHVRKRKQKALDHLDTEVQMQLQKQREKLNHELQSDLDKCLLEQKQSFLGHIAALVNLAPKELQDILKKSNKTAADNKSLTAKSEHSEVSLPGPSSFNSADAPETLSVSEKSDKPFHSSDRLPPISPIKTEVRKSSFEDASDLYPMTTTAPIVNTARSRRRKRRREILRNFEKPVNDK